MKKLIGILLCAILLINGALAETGSILVDLKEPDRGTFPDPNTTVTFELYRIAVPNGSTESAWAPSLEGLKLPEGKDWDYENDVVKLEQDAVAIIEAADPAIDPVDTKSVEYGKTVKFEGLDAGIYLGIATDKPARLSVSPFTVAVPSLSAQDPYNVEVIPKTEYTQPNPTSIPGEKFWTDDEDFDGMRPAEITVELMRAIPGASPAPVETKTVTPNDKGEWKYEFTGLPDSDADMKPYTYSVTDKVTGYTCAPEQGSAYDIRNTHEVEYGALEVTKEVTVNGVAPTDDNKNFADGTYTIHVEGPKEYTDGKTKNDLNYFSEDFDFVIVDGEADAKLVSDKLMPGTYTITEKPLSAEMAAKHPGMVVPEAQEITVEAGTTAEAPAKVTVTNNQPVGALKLEKKVTIDGNKTPADNTDPSKKTLNWADDTYHFTVTGPNSFLDEVDIEVKDGKMVEPAEWEGLMPGEYTVNESLDASKHPGMTAVKDLKVTVSAGTTAESAVIATATNNQPVGGLRITKSVTSNGAANAADGTYYFTVTGPHDYKNTVSISITGGQSNHTDLSDLFPGTYTIAEDTSRMPNRVSLSGANNRTVEVKANVAATDQSVNVTFLNQYTTPPPRNPTPTPTATNTPTPTPEPTPTPTPAIDVPAQKVWNDENNAHGTRPRSITVHLLANGSVIETRQVSGGGNTWNFTFANLPQLDEYGNAISYTVSEDSVSGYTTRYDGRTIINDLIPRTTERYTSISGTKTWRDNGNASGSRPNYITVRLLRDGREVERRTVTAANGWQYTFANIPVDDGYGNIYTYSIREDAVPGYFSTASGDDLINTLLPPPEPPLERFEIESIEEMEDLLDLFDYGTPLWGELLKTGDETPIYPFVFGGVGVVALAALILLLLADRKKKKSTNA